MNGEDRIFEENNVDDIPIEYKIGEFLCSKSLTISTAESCTGGMVASKLIGYPGISEVFKEGAITYSNEAKIKRLGVNKETLENFGAVSYETAVEMAQGIAREACTDIGISTTGIAGPGGGTNEKPVGLVYIAIKIKNKTVVKKFMFDGNREHVRYKATISALEMINKEIKLI